MIALRYRCDGFDANYGNQFEGSHNFHLEWNDLIWAAISVGKLGYDDLMGYGAFSLDEIRFRTYLIYSHLMQDGNRICKSPLYESLDSTEKGAASYFLGMAVSRIVGAFLLNIPWLVHLEKIKALYNVVILGKSRPDLLGLNSQGQWIVFEAKGRSQGYSQYALDKAKDQTRHITSISGLAPILRVATESFFDPFLSVRVADPKNQRNREINVQINEAQFLSSYYLTFENIMRFSPQTRIVGSQRYSFVNYESAGISVGINQHVLDRLQHGEIRRDDFKNFPKNVDTHGQSPWHFTGQASLDLNPGPPAISHTQ